MPQDQQTEFRDAFVKEQLRAAWGFGCRVAYIRTTQLDRMQKDVSAIRGRVEQIASEIKTLESAVDFHTVENREKVKALREENSTLLARLSGGDKHPGLLAMTREVEETAGKSELQEQVALGLAEFATGWTYPTRLEPGVEVPVPLQS